MSAVDQTPPHHENTGRWSGAEPSVRVTMADVHIYNGVPVAPVNEAKARSLRRGALAKLIE